MAGIPKIVGERLRAKANVADHPDANLLAAFAERSLGKNDRDRVLEHLARCMDCRDVVALSIPESLADAAVAPSARWGWLSWPAMRWAAAGACVVVVGAAVGLHYRTARNSSEYVTRETATMNATQDAESKAVPQAPSEVAPMAQAHPKSYVAERVAKNAPAPPAFDALKKADSAPREPATLEARKSTTVEVTGAAGTVTSDADNGNSSQIAELVPGRAKDAMQAAPVPAANAPAANAMMSPAVASASRTGIGGGVFPAAKIIPRWTLTSDGTLQRSLDSGRSWEKIPVSSNAAFRALAANGLDIWVGGAAGALYHSADAGEHWVQVQPTSDGEILTADIIGVEFTDATHGKITTTDQHTWITEDAGQNWLRK